ncbi:S-adenosyl-L-methionine-dependent tRNA 4-demethylwyosine synthase TYW1-like [Neopsephotus bourkii]|uniref:S-adenosyl-L-methionine-dependent tRNA 4-demethylwyosine synthase TYW1-like n=1 Tax=Neopsephotus bourkii TaxID=309878 RepID=UPI002AA519EB|nr:S-adenosyl-L-methionine-dependent tRNA 4-demethylwyosine synthase TYW1-like [Neopsephotus bourkii]
MWLHCPELVKGQADDDGVHVSSQGVTYCGKSSASNLTMANVPWHEEVVHFVQELANLIPDYEIACEHEHSNCLLIAHKKFKINGEWCTWIDYDRFQELVRAQEQSGGSQTFTAADYAARTPHWALFGSRERGFDPLDVRYHMPLRSPVHPNSPGNTGALPLLGWLVSVRPAVVETSCPEATDAVVLFAACVRLVPEQRWGMADGREQEIRTRNLPHGTSP